MKKKGLALLVALLLVFGLVACTDLTTTTSSGTTTTTSSGTTTTTTSTTTTTTVSTAALTISFSGLTDAGFTPEDKIIAGEWFDLLAGVSALGSNSVDYKNQITFSSEDDACQIEDGKLMATGAKTCIVTYEVVVQSKIVRQNRNIKISPAPVVMDFTATDKWVEATMLGTPGAVLPALTADAVTNVWYYWTNIASVNVAIADNQLQIDQDAIGGNEYSLQVKVKTDIELEVKRTYKMTFTVDAEVARYIDIVVKAQNADAGYGDDVHNILELEAGVHEYEIVFVAPQNLLHLNIMTGNVELDTRFGLLKFSDFVLYEGPIVYNYEEVEGLFTNAEYAVGTEILPIPTGGTDSDFIRQFYYWTQPGVEIAAEYVEGGVEVEVITPAVDDYGIQIQFNDMLKADFTLIKGAHYKLTMKVNATTARIFEVNVTGDHHSKPVSVSQRFDLVVGDNTIEVEFASLYDYFFMKLNFGNYGDLVQTGTFTITDLKLFEEADPVIIDPEDPIDEGAVIGNIFGTPTNVDGALVSTPATDPVGEFFLWVGTDMGWNSGWTAFAEASGTYAAGVVTVDIVNESAPEFWGVQLKYHGGEITIGIDYMVAFTIVSDVARTINVEVHNASGQYASQDFDLVVGTNYIELPFEAQFGLFNLQLNLGNFSEADESGVLVLSNFMLTRAVVEVADYVVNGDFETEMVTLGASDAEGWAVWTTAGIGDPWAQPNYGGTATITGGKLTLTTTAIGGAEWASQIQYNHGTADLTVGAIYKVVLDINASVATTIQLQLKGATNDGPHSTQTVSLVAGDNHVTVYLTAMQTTFRFFILNGLTEVGTTLVVDNILVYEPNVPVVEPVEEPVIGNVFGTPTNVDGALVSTPATDPVGEFFLWVGTNMGWNSGWTAFAEASGTYAAGVVTVDIVNESAPEFWGVQLKYHGGEITIGTEYMVAFTLVSDVARTINVEVHNASGQYATQNFDLVVGTNYIELPFTAQFALFNLQLNLGNFSVEDESGVLVLSNFMLTRAVVEVADYVVNGDFETELVTLGASDAEGWAVWTTAGIGDPWAQPNYGGTATITGGKLVLTTTAIGGAEWASQIQYNHGTADLTVGAIYKVVLDINANVATTIQLQLKGASNDGPHSTQTVSLVAGDNHVTVYLTAMQETFRFFILNGLTEVGTTLVIDNILVYEPLVPVEEEPTPAWTGYGMDAVVTGNAVTATYTNIPGEWWTVNLQNPLSEFDGTKTSILFTFIGVAGTEYLFKIEGGGQFVETPVVATGASQELVLDLSALTEVQRDGLNLIIVFVKTVAASGTLTIEGWEYVIPSWVGYGMEVVVTGASVTATYTATPAAWWNNNLQSPIAAFDGSRSSIIFTYTGVAGVSYLFKIEGGGQFVELASVATGASQEVTLDLSGLTEVQRDALNLIIVFVQTEGAAGTFTVEGWRYVIPAWTGYGMEVVVTGASVTATYTATPAAWWNNNLQSPIADFDGTKTGIVFTYTGVAGVSYLFKIEGNGQFLELASVATGASQTVTLDLSAMTEAQRDGLNLIVVFVQTEGAAGTFTVTGWDYVV